MTILNEKQQNILKEERSLLHDLQVGLIQFGAAQEDIDTLAQTIRQMDELFLLVIVGEFNAGKSAFINALLGKKLLAEGVTPTTTQINLLRYGKEHTRSVIDENLHVISLPVDLLTEISIVDTPGTNAIIRAHEAITGQFVPRSDLVLFLTSADRPFTESERLFMERIRNWGKKVVVVINKVDILQDEDELSQVRNFVSENARQLLGVAPEIFTVSARKALQAKSGQPDLWAESRFEPLETYIFDTLDEEGRIRLKLLSPLGVADHLVDKYLKVINDRLGLLKDDFSTISEIESQLELYKEDMQRDFNFRMSDIENILFEMESRGDEFFEDTFRLARVFDLLNKERIQQEYEQYVVADTPQKIERKVSELIDWLVDSDLRQWQAVTEHLAERRREHQDRIVGNSTIGSFHYDRERLIEAVGREAQRVVDTYDKTQEAEEIAMGAQTAVAASAAIEAGAIGLGTLVTILATTVAADVTGILLASVIAALGLFVIPTRRKMAKTQMREKIADLRDKLTRSLRGQFEKEIDRSLHSIREAISPYTRFIRAEKSKMEETHNSLDKLNVEIEKLRAAVELQ